jgi:hypothetical protein
MMIKKLIQGFWLFSMGVAFWKQKQHVTPTGLWFNRNAKATNISPLTGLKACHEAKTIPPLSLPLIGGDDKAAFIVIKSPPYQ